MSVEQRNRIGQLLDEFNDLVAMQMYGEEMVLDSAKRLQRCEDLLWKLDPVSYRAAVRKVKAEMKRQLAE